MISLPHLVVHPRAPRRRSQGRRPRHRVREGRLLRQGRRLHASPCRRCGTSASAISSSASSACARSCAPKDCSTRRARSRSRSSRTSSGSSPARDRMPRRTCTATPSCAGRRCASARAYASVQGDRCVPETIGALKALDADPDVDVIVIARGGGDPQTPAGLQRRATPAGGGCGIHPRRQRHRTRERPSAARRRRRPARLDADRRGQARGSGCRGAACPRGAAAVATDVAPHAARHARHRPARAAAIPPVAARPGIESRRALAGGVPARRRAAATASTARSRRARDARPSCGRRCGALSPASTLARGYAIAHLVRRRHRAGCRAGSGRHAASSSRSGAGRSPHARRARSPRTRPDGPPTAAGAGSAPN